MPHRKLIRRLQDTPIGVQLGIILTIGLMPIGMISISQATRAIDETRELADTALIGEVTTAALQEIDLFSDALATAEALGHQVLDENNNLIASCDAQIGKIIENYSHFLFAGFITSTGMMVCSSSGDRLDFSESPVFARLLTYPTGTIRAVDRGAISGRNALVATSPIYRDAVLQGFVSVSIPMEVLRLTARSGEEAPVYRVAIVDNAGRVLASNSRAEDDEIWIPHDLPDLLADQPFEHVFERASQSGNPRPYALTPIFSDQIYALATPIREGGAAYPAQHFLSAYLLPVAMWGIGLLVSLLAIHRLVIRHLTALRLKMHAFEAGERNIRDLALAKAPGELAELGESFARMISTITQDEMIQEEALKEKNVLLREVYHRVKNNLQLILSIMSMQSRNVSSPAAKTELARLQRRVMSIANMHQLLYTVPELRAVRADAFLGEIIRNLVAAGSEDGSVALDLSLDPITLNPDQAVPLSLYVSEAVTNALKHALTGRKEGLVSVSLTRDEDGLATLQVTNTTAPLPDGVAELPSGGLGTRLMMAFAQQLGATEERIENPDEYNVTLQFSVQSDPEPETVQPQAALSS